MAKDSSHRVIMGKILLVVSTLAPSLLTVSSSFLKVRRTIFFFSFFFFALEELYFEILFMIQS